MLFLMASPLCAQVLTVRNIAVQGNKKTKTAVILREVHMLKGDTISEPRLTKQLQLIKENVVNTNLFLEVEVTPLSDPEGYLDLLIWVKERWYMSILPMLALGDRSFNEWWYERGRDLSRLTYGLNVNHFNFSGNGDVLTANVHLGFTPYYQLAYSRPYIDKQKRLGFTARAFYASRKALPFKTWNDKLTFASSDHTLYQRVGGAIDFKYRDRINYYHTWTGGFSNTQISDTIALANPEYFGDSRTNQNLLYTGYEFRADFRDFRQYAERGHLFFSSVYHYVALKGRNQTNVNLNFHYFQPLGARFFWDSQLRGKASFPRTQSYFLVSGLGYGGNIARGYELYVIDGQFFALSRNTIKNKVMDRSFDISWLIRKKEFSSLPLKIYPNLYFDVAYVRNFQPQWSNSRLSNRTLLGGGVGLDIVTFYNVNIRAYYSVNQMKERNLFFTFGREF